MTYASSAMTLVARTAITTVVSDSIFTSVSCTRPIYNRMWQKPMGFPNQFVCLGQEVRLCPMWRCPYDAMVGISWAWVPPTDDSYAGFCVVLGINTERKQLFGTIHNWNWSLWNTKIEFNHTLYMYMRTMFITNDYYSLSTQRSDITEARVPLT